jgi:hypothetical protein
LAIYFHRLILTEKQFSAKFRAFVSGTYLGQPVSVTVEGKAANRRCHHQMAVAEIRPLISGRIWPAARPMLGFS